MQQPQCYEYPVEELEVPRFKRMKPRVGIQYQTKVPKASIIAFDKYESNRPIPSRLSTDYAHLTTKEVDEYQKGPIKAYNDNEPSEPITTANDTGLRTSDQVRRVGGTCVHRSNRSACKTEDDAELIQQVPPISTEAFCQEMISRYGSSSNSRGRKKRQAADEWTSCPILAECHMSDLFRYDEESRLQHLETQFGGNVDAAELDVRVRLSNGTARKARRILLKTLHSSRFKRPAQSSSASWRERLQLTMGMWGDLRTEPSPMDHSCHADIPIPVEPVLACDDDMKGVWRSILSYGQSMERAAAAAAAGAAEHGGARPSVLEVVNFMRKAYELPWPEESFGNRHVCVEQLSECFHNLQDHVARARDARAGLLDFLADDEEGIDMEALRKLLDDQLPKACPLALSEETILRKEILMASEWQAQVDALLENPPEELDCLAVAKELASKARTFGVRTRGLVCLEKRIEKAHQFQERLEGWDQHKCTNTVKSVAALVRDVNRVNLPSVFVRRLLNFNKELECWVERCNIAIRSRISLSEVESLIHRAESMPLNLSEFLDKLHARVRIAKAWISDLEDKVPCVHTTDVEGNPVVDQIGWMMSMRLALAEDQSKGGKCSMLVDLCSEGARIPVEITAMKLLQIEIDAKNWMQKAEKWIPGSRGSKRGKIEELREHLEKAAALRDRLPCDERDRWVLDYEAEIESIVTAADSWFEEFQTYVDWDNRRNNAQECLSLEKLRRIVSEGTAIHANVGNAVSKMARILTQAESWFNKNLSLLVRAGIQTADGNLFVGKVALLELTNAVSDAASDISLDLQEAIALQEVVDKIHRWVERTGNAAPIKRSKRVGKGRWSSKPIRFRESDLVDLIEEAKLLPIPTDDEVHRLRTQLDEVQAWRRKAHADLREIASGFQSLGTSIQSMHGTSQDFYTEESRIRMISDDERPPCVQKAMTLDVDTSAERMDIEMAEPVLWVADVVSLDDLPRASESTLSCSLQEGGPSALSERDTNNEGASRTEASSGGESDSITDSDCVVDTLIVALLSEARQTGVLTTEEQLLTSLEKISKWCAKSLKTLECPTDLYETRTFSNFNRLIETGRELLETPEAEEEGEMDRELSQLLRSSWSAVVKEQLERLDKLRVHRDKFVEWSNTSRTLLAAKDKKLTIEAVHDLADESRQYPSSTEIVQRIQNLAKRVSNWKERVTAHLDSSEKKMTMQEAKSLLEEGDKLKLVCHETKVLRNAIRLARVWLNQVKKCKLGHGGTAAADLESLIDDHESLMISMPEEVAKLKQATQGFCLCRRPYEGFMIGCDECEEWYHGPCIGITESQADRYDKYVCVRCYVKRAFDASVNVVASTIKKWTSAKDRKKARQAEYQKHQRKVRKEKKDIEKLELKIRDHYLHFASLQNGVANRIDDGKLLYFGQPTLCKVADGSIDAACIANDEHSIEIAKKPSIESLVRGVESSSLTESDSGAACCSEVATISPKHCSSISEGHHSSYDVTSQLRDCGVVRYDAEPCSLTSLAAAAEAMEKSHSSSDHHAKGTDALKEDIEQKICELRQAICSCNERLERLCQIAQERSDLDRQEDRCCELLKIWCIRVRARVLVPSTQKEADRGRPTPDGSLSQPMLDLFKDAETLGIATFQDVHLVASAFQSICWASLAMSTLAKRSSLKEIQHVLNSAAAIALADEKAIKMLKSIVQRTTVWQLKVRKALAPKPGETKPISMDLLNGLDDGSPDLPFEIPETFCLASAIEDKGHRHCICGGANDGTFMLGCDKCEEWFHGRCVGINKEYGNKLDSWLCPSCKGEQIDLAELSIDNFNHDDIEDDANLSQESAPCAPSLGKLWPPFKLLGSAESREALGDECVMIPDSYGHLEVVEGGERTSQNGDQHAAASAYVLVDQLVKSKAPQMIEMRRTELDSADAVTCTPAIVVDDQLPIAGSTLDSQRMENAVAIAVGTMNLHVDAAHNHSTWPIGNPCM